MTDSMRAMARGWWLVPLALVTALVGTRLLTDRIQPVYRASMTMVVAPAADLESVGDVLRAVETLERRSLMATLAELARSPRLRALAAEAAAWPDGADQSYDVSATVMPHANVLRISAEGPDRHRVTEIVEGLGTAVSRETTRLYRPFHAEVLAPARIPGGPILPDARRNYVVAAVLGLFLGLTMAFFFGQALPALPRLAWPPMPQARGAD